MKKRVLSVLLCMVMLLAGCGSKTNDVVTTTSEEVTSEDVSSEEVESTEESNESNDEEYGGNNSVGDSAFTMTEEETAEEATEEQVKFNDALEESLYNLVQEGKVSDLTYEKLLEVYDALKADISDKPEYKYVRRFVGVTYEDTTVYDEPVTRYKLYVAMSDDDGATEYPFTLGVTYWSDGSTSGMMAPNTYPCEIPEEFAVGFTNTETWYDHIVDGQKESKAAKESELNDAIAEYNLKYDWQKDYMKGVVEGKEPYTIPDIDAVTYGVYKFCDSIGISYDKVKSIHQDDRDGEMIDDDGNHVYEVVHYVANDSPSTVSHWITLKEDGTFIPEE